jgi:hypothetical protein
MNKRFRFDLTLEEMVDVFNGLDSYLEHLDGCLQDRIVTNSSEETLSKRRERVSQLYMRLLSGHTGMKKGIRWPMAKVFGFKDIT